MVKVSVLMPVYNLEDYIEHAMESLFNQTLKDIEIVCVNDGSVDNSLEVLNEFASKYDFIKVFSQENMGAGPALNKCIEEATGEYIAFLDADDIYVDDDALEKMYNWGVENNADMVAGNLKFVEGDDYKIVDADHYKRKLYRLCDKKTSISPDHYGIPYAFYKNIFKREFLNKHNIRFPPYKRGVDTLFLARALVNVERIYTIPVWLYGYNHAVGGGFNKKLSDYDFIRNFFKVFKGVFDIFYEAGFDKVAHEFKKELIMYFNFQDNATDWGIYQLVLEVFGEDGSYFEDFKPEYEVFVATQLINYVYENPTEEVYVKTKEEISEIELVHNKKSTEDLFKKAHLLMSSDSLPDFRQNYLEYSYLTIEKENEKLAKKVRSLKRKNSKINKELKKERNLNKSLINSSSWKLTKPLRAFKRVLKK
ncbi:glycosyltransferase family 2 protein [Methanobrevibacter sp.]